MIVKCMICGKELDRKHPKKKNFCCCEHRDLWMQMHTDFAALSRGHKAKHLTELNRQRNPHCKVADRGKSNSHKARAAAETYLGRALVSGEVVHHMNGNATDNSEGNLLVMTDRQHKQLHMALAMEQMEGQTDAGK